MPQFNLEYAIAVYQQGVFTFAAKEHRRVNGNPSLTIDVKATHVEWTIDPLTQGNPDSNYQQPQKNRFDLYFLLRDICPTTASWPTTSTVPAIWSGANNNQGTERPGGKSIKMTTPVGRLSGISKLVAQVGFPSQPFTAEATSLNLFADIEHTPQGKLYASEESQFHLGFQGTYQYKGGAQSTGNRVVIEMSKPIYEAIRLKLISLCIKSQ